MAELYTIPDDIRAEILRRLKTIEREHGVDILLAIESGSRAWGFPSPDSDFDVRFIYVRKLTDYVSLFVHRDVIETPIEGDYDINGWDIRKGLQLMLKANPVFCEWMRSPIVYREQSGVRQAFEELLLDVDERVPASHHHYGLLKSNYFRRIDGVEQVKLKAYFYCLRPAFALHWMWQNPDGKLPMRFDLLRAGIQVPADIAAIVDDLVAKKLETREMGRGPRISVLDDFFVQTMEKAEASGFGTQAPIPEQLSTKSEQFFHRMTGLTSGV